MADIFELFKKIQKPAPSNEPITHLIVGLGNYGKEYDGTRHNCGFMALDYIQSKYNVECKKLKFKSLVTDATIDGHHVLLMKPQTYMNNSGEAVRDAAEFYKIPPENIIIIVDDINLDPGHVRIRKSGSAGGHNGLKNIIYHLNSDAFPRIRIGVGAKPKEYDLVDWVLGKIPQDQQSSLYECFTWTPDIICKILSGKTDDAMGTYNGKIAGEDNKA